MAELCILSGSGLPCRSWLVRALWQLRRLAQPQYYRNTHTVLHMSMISGWAAERVSDEHRVRLVLIQEAVGLKGCVLTFAVL